MRSPTRRGPSWSRHLERVHLFRRERGLLIAHVGAFAPLLGTFAGGYTIGTTYALAGSAGGLLVLGGLLLRWRPWLARGLAIAGVGVTIALVAPDALEHPELLVLGALTLWMLLSLLLAEPRLHGEQESTPPSPRRTARTACLTALVAWFLGVLLRPEPSPMATLCAAAPIATATGLALRWVSHERSRPLLRVALAALTLAAAVLAALLAAERSLALSCLAAVPLSTLAVSGGDDEASALGGLVEHPARLLVATFVALAAAGAVVLALPAASASTQAVAILDSAFTATSAVCVTGLIVLDTPNAFSPFGQAAILVLIQVGGLGIMTFYTVAFAALGRRLSLRHERAIAGAVNVEDRRQLVTSLRRVLLVTFTAEALGALLLFAAFAVREPPGAAVWRAVFTSVSAFCNAGFALQTDSLVPYQTDPLVLYTVAGLIVAGGLSPIGVLAVPRWLRGGRLELQERVVLSTSAALLVAGTALYLLFEWSDSLGALTWPDRAHNAIFQSVTLRTAGFNSVDLTATRPETQTMMIVFMLVGGSPGGTAGGVKTTTVAVVAAMVIATLRGAPEAEAFGRRIGRATVFKAGAVVTVGVVAFIVGLVAIQLTQAIELDVAAFEVASALGTVGLSIGGTSMLDSVGKIAVMACMFAGRVGPLTLFLFLTEQQHEPPVGHPVQEVDVG